MNIHAKHYIDEVFSARLREEGFLCPDDKSLCWYRIKGEEIVNSIVFYSAWTTIPIHLSIGYGIHPLFLKPVHTTSVSYPNSPISDETFRYQALVEDFPISRMMYTPYSGDIPVYAPGRNGRGIFTFDGVILPKMESVRTMQKVYQMHKELLFATGYGQKKDIVYNVPATFCDEAIYMNDTEMYPYFVPGSARNIDTFRELCQTKPNNKEYKVSLQEWEARRNALLSDTGRLEYLAILERRKAANMKQLKKWGLVL